MIKYVEFMCHDKVRGVENKLTDLLAGLRERGCMHAHIYCNLWLNLTNWHSNKDGYVEDDKWGILSPQNLDDSMATTCVECKTIVEVVICEHHMNKQRKGTHGILCDLLYIHKLSCTLWNLSHIWAFQGCITYMSCWEH